jgi:hypothetical protein
MRIVALVAGHGHYGEITDAKATVGEITAGGTAFLLVAGAFVGMFGGLAYVVVRRWLPGPTFAKGLTFGFLVLIVVGTGVIDGENLDFTRFVSPYLAVGLFAAIFVLFGLLVAGLVERFTRSVVLAPSRRSVTFAGGAGLATLTAYRLVGDIEELSRLF